MRRVDPFAVYSRHRGPPACHDLVSGETAGRHVRGVSVPPESAGWSMRGGFLFAVVHGLSAAPLTGTPMPGLTPGWPGAIKGYRFSRSRPASLTETYVCPARLAGDGCDEGGAATMLAADLTEEAVAAPLVTAISGAYVLAASPIPVSSASAGSPPGMQRSSRQRIGIRRMRHRYRARDHDLDTLVEKRTALFHPVKIGS